MQIYQAEIDAGLQDQILNSKISIACDLFTKSDYVAGSSQDILLQSIAKANPNQRDLFYKHSILASVGWNDNDDVFDKLETWNARNSPVDKQMNFMHNELEIIGHSTQSLVYGVDGNLILDDTPIDKLPDKFDVVTEFVLYQMWDNAERQAQINKLIAEIDEGKWFVSMECRFPNFDYAIIDVDKQHKTVARNAQTAFLTKHLRAFGGTGEYEGRRIGRLIRNFFFSGQGIVDKPANRRSIIFNNAIVFNSKGNLVITKGNNKMEEQLQKQVAELKAQLDAVNAEKAKEMDDKAKCMKEEAEKANKAKSALETEVAELKANIAAKDTAIAALTDELKETNTKLATATAEIEAAKKVKAFADRVTKLTVAGLADEEAKAVATKWESLSEAQFGDMVDIYKAKIEAAKAAATTTTQVTETAKADLTKAQAEVTPALNTNADANVNQELDTISKYLGGAMKYYSHAQKVNDKK